MGYRLSSIVYHTSPITDFLKCGGVVIIVLGIIIKRMHKKSTLWHVCLPREKIALFQWILGEYDGLAQFHTLDSFKAVVELMIPPGNEPEITRVIQALQEEWQCEIKIMRP